MSELMLSLEKCPQVDRAGPGLVDRGRLLIFHWSIPDPYL